MYILLPMDKLWLTMDWVPRVGWVWGDQCAEVTNPFTKLQMKNALWDEGKKETLTEVRLWKYSDTLEAPHPARIYPSNPIPSTYKL